MREITEKLAPHDVDAERAVLGAIVMDGRLFDQAAQYLEAGDFYLGSHRAIYRAMAYVAGNTTSSDAIDMVTLVNALSATGTDINDIGGKSYLSGLIDGLPRYSNIENYCRIIKDKSMRRQTIALCDTTARECYDESNNVSSIADKMFVNVGLVTSSVDEAKLVHVGEMVDADIEAASRRIEGEDTDTEELLVKVPWPMFAKRYRLFPNKTCSFICARPSLGKSTMAVNLAVEWAKAGKNVTYISKEDSPEATRMRMYCYESQVPLDHVMYGMSKDESKAFRDAANSAKQWSIYMNNSASISWTETVSTIKNHQRMRGTDVVFIDYIQEYSENSEAYDPKLGVYAQQMRQLALDLGMIVIICCQLSRTKDASGRWRRPTIQDLRSSGKLEEAAHVILLLHQDGFEDPDGEKDRGIKETEIIVGKNKNGTKGTERIWFDGGRMRFIERQILPEVKQMSKADMIEALQGLNQLYQENEWGDPLTQIGENIKSKLTGAKLDTAIGNLDRMKTRHLRYELSRLFLDRDIRETTEVA